MLVKVDPCIVCGEPPTVQCTVCGMKWCDQCAPTERCPVCGEQATEAQADAIDLEDGE